MQDDLPVAAWEINPGEIILHEKVGTGCTAEVFRGTFKNQLVAVKRIEWIKAPLAMKEQRSFERELAILLRIRHDNLVKFLGVKSQSTPFEIITEFCSGGCVFELLHNHDDINLTWKQQHKMCLDVALAMEYLHKFDPPIIHRDLKSLNLLLLHQVTSPEFEPIVKVSDFGLSRMKDTTADSWGKMTVQAGTCHWMAPEVWHGTDYDEKVDVYSYSMILFEVICREVPFEDEEGARVGRLIMEGTRPDLEAVPPDCPPVLAKIMIDCWHAQPATRPPFEVIVQMLRSLKF